MLERVNTSDTGRAEGRSPSAFFLDPQASKIRLRRNGGQGVD